MFVSGCMFDHSISVGEFKLANLDHRSFYLYFIQVVAPGLLSPHAFVLLCPPSVRKETASVWERKRDQNAKLQRDLDEKKCSLKSAH